jgi:hypothetical protein
MAMPVDFSRKLCYYMIMMQFTQHDDLLDIRYDNVFKAVFTKETPESRKALSYLVSAFALRIRYRFL